MGFRHVTIIKRGGGGGGVGWGKASTTLSYIYVEIESEIIYIYQCEDLRILSIIIGKIISCVVCLFS